MSEGGGVDEGGSSTVTLPTFNQTPPILTPITTTPTTTGGQPGYTGGGAQSIPTPGGDFQVVNGQVFDPNGNVTTVAALQNALGFPASPGASASAQGPSLTQILQAAATATGAAASAYKSLQTPSLIPGTNLVYDPASGTIRNAATGLTGQQTVAAGAGVSGISPTMILLLAGGLIAVMAFSGKGR
jgi:hypothetical protein